MGIYTSGDQVIVVFRNGIVTVSSEGIIQSSDYNRFGEVFSEVPVISKLNNYLVMSSTYYSVVLQGTANHFWMVNRFF